MMLKSYPKVFQFGDRHVLDILEGQVEITEKLDGSQFSFGNIDGEPCFRSKGCQIHLDSVPNLFTPAVDYILGISEILPLGVTFYGETLCKPKHNTLEYKSVPKNHIALFAGMFEDGSALSPELLGAWAKQLDVDVVPRLFVGDAPSLNYEDILMFIRGLLERESYLGGPKVEGVVVKNYGKEMSIMGTIFPFKQAKYVSEAFKEIHKKSWSKENTGRGRWEEYKLAFKTEARWNKAVQHLRDNGLLEGAPRDIGAIMKEIARDISEEEKENIKDYLWHEFGKDVIRTAQQGVPEWYKEQLIRNVTTAPVELEEATSL